MERGIFFYWEVEKESMVENGAHCTVTSEVGGDKREEEVLTS